MPCETPFDAGYDRYVRKEWELFESDPSRAAVTLQSLGDHPFRRVLELGKAVRTLDLPLMVHSLRVLASGVLYWICGRQPSNRITGSEIFHTESLLRRELAGGGLVISSTITRRIDRYPDVRTRQGIVNSLLVNPLSDESDSVAPPD